MDKYAKRGARVLFTGLSQNQINWGGGDDPAGVLVVGQVYVVDHVQVRSSYSLVYLKNTRGRFNTVGFEDVAAAPEVAAGGAHFDEPSFGLDA